METPIAEFTCTWHYKEWVTALAFVLVTIVYPGIEYWFGKTKRTPAGSALEFLILMIKPLFWKRREPQKLLCGHVHEELEMNPLTSSLEGREIDQKIGTAITLFVDVKDDLKVQFGGEVDSMVLLDQLAAKTSKGWLKFGISSLNKFLGRSAPAVAATSPAPATEPDSDDASMMMAATDIKEESGTQTGTSV